MTGFDLTPRLPPPSPLLDGQVGNAVPELSARGRAQLARENRRLSQAVDVALQSNPDFAAEAQRIGLEINASPEAIERDLDGYRTVMRRLEIAKWQRAQTNPVLRLKMLNPRFGNVTQDDIDTLSVYERFQVGRLQRELGVLRTQERDVGLSDSDLSRRQHISRYLRSLPESQGVLNITAELAGLMGPGFAEALETGLTAGAAAGLAALGLGQLGPQALFPEELGTVPAAAIKVGGAAFMARLFKESVDVEGGLAYDAMLEQGIDPTIAAGASRWVGVVSGALETASGGVLAFGGRATVRAAARAFLPAGRQAMVKGISQGAAEALKTPTLMRASATLAGGWATAMVIEMGTEAAQEFTQIVGADIARVADGQSSLLQTAQGRDEAWGQIGDVVAKTFQGMLLLSAPGPTVRFVSDYQRVRHSQRNAAELEAEFESLAESKTAERSPRHVEEFVGAVDTEVRGEPETVIIAGARLSDALAQTGTTIEQLAKVSPEMAQQLPQAVTSGGDVVVTKAQYLAQVTRTPLHDALKQHIRKNDPNTASPAEIQEFIADFKAAEPVVAAAIEETVTFAKSAEQAREDFLEQVVATGRLNEADAKAAADTYRAFVETAARRFGVTPMDLAAAMGLRVERGETAQEAEKPFKGLTRERDTSERTPEENRTRMEAKLEGREVEDDIVRVFPSEIATVEEAERLMDRALTLADNASHAAATVESVSGFMDDYRRLKARRAELLAESPAPEADVGGVGSEPAAPTDESLTDALKQVWWRRKKEPKPTPGEEAAQKAVDEFQETEAIQQENALRDIVLAAMLHRADTDKRKSIIKDAYLQGLIEDYRVRYPSESGRPFTTELVRLLDQANEEAAARQERGEGPGELPRRRMLPRSPDTLHQTDKTTEGAVKQTLWRGTPSKGFEPDATKVDDARAAEGLSRTGVFHFSQDKGVAEQFGTARQYSVTIDNPFTDESPPIEGLGSADATLVDQIGGQPEWVEKIKAAGYDGIAVKGIDRPGSPSTVEYVAFSPDQVKLLDETLQQGEEEVRGAFHPEKGLIRLFEKAKLDTILHELSHSFLHFYGQLAGTPVDAMFPGKDADALAAAALERQKIRDELEAFLDWRGLAGGTEAWNAMTLEQQRPHHEAFAEAFEVYIYNGQAPTLSLKRLFQRMRAVVVSLWRRIRGEMLELDPTIRGIFDRMLASEDAIQHTAEARAMISALDEKPADWSIERWAKYQQEQDDALQAAHDDVRAKSLRAMRWGKNAAGRELSKLQKAAAEIYDKVRAEEMAKASLEREYRALEFIRNGVFLSETGTEVEFQGDHKLETEATKAALPEGRNLRSLKWTNKDGRHPDDVADMFGFESGEYMVRQLLDTNPIDEVVDARTAQRLELEHGDLGDAKKIQEAIDDALHNPLRSKFLAAQLSATMKFSRPATVLRQAARELAQAQLSQMPVGSIKTSRFQAVEERMRRELKKAWIAGDTATAEVMARNELLHHEMAREAAKIEKMVARADKTFRKYRGRDNAKNIGGVRDVDIVATGRWILTMHGYAMPEGVRAENLLPVIAEKNPELADEFGEVIARVTELDGHGRTPLMKLPLGEFEILHTALAALWYRAARERQIQVGEKTRQLEDVVAELLEALGEIDEHPLDQNLTEKEIDQSEWAKTVASVRHAEAWAIKQDGGTTGVVHRYLFALLRDAFTLYETKKVDILRPLDNLVRAHKIDRDGAVTTLSQAEGGVGFTFRDKLELLGMLLHIGNASNLRKHLLGMGWVDQPTERGGPIDESRWWNTVQDLVERGWITEADMALVQKVWDTFDKVFPDSQATHKGLYGYEADAIEAREFAIQFGDKTVTYKGGYYPASVDRRMAERFAQRNVKEAEQRLAAGAISQEQFDNIKHMAEAPLEPRDPFADPSQEFRNGMPTAGRGFMKSRTEINWPLVTDLRTVSFELDKHLRFTYMQQAGRDFYKILNHSRIRTRLGSELVGSLKGDEKGMFMSLLEDTLHNRVMKPSGNPLLDHGVKIGPVRLPGLPQLRTITGIATQAGNIGTAFLQLTGLGAAVNDVSPTEFRAATWNFFRQLRFGRNPMAQEAIDESEFMRTRIEHGTGQLRDDLENLHDTGKLSNQRKWIREHAYFLQHLAQSPVDVIVWHAARNDALKQGRSREDAVRHADALVRRTQSSAAAPDISSLERGNPQTRLFTQFITPFMAMGNQVIHAQGKKDQVLRSAVLIGGVLVLGDAMIEILRGGWDDEDENGRVWDDVAEWTAGASVRGAATLFLGPFGGIGNVLTDEFGGRMGSAAAIAMFNRAVRGVWGTLGAVGSGITGEGFDISAADARGVADMATILTGGIPFSFVGRRIQTTARELEDPDTGVVGTVVRGMIVGR